MDQWDNIQVFEDGLFIGEIHSWSGENSWDNWRGDVVRNEYFGFNFNSVTMGDQNHMDWNYIGGVHGDERYVIDAVLDEEYHDESHIRVDFNVEAPASDASGAELTAWAALDPQTDSIDWATIDIVRSGESSWTQYATPDGAQNDRDEESSNTEARREFFERVDVDYDGDGQVDWTDESFMGSWQERDGFVEIYDKDWNLVSRELAPGSGLTLDALLTQITTDEGAEAAAMFSAAWTQIEGYLPAGAQDTATLRFTQNEWGELFVFGGDNSEMLLRVNANTNVDFSEEPWDDTFGWTKWESSWFDVQDADWNQIANINQWTRSKATTEDYNAAEDPETADIWKKDATGDESQIRVYKDDVGITWSTFFKSEYELNDDLLEALSDFSGQQILAWDDITSLSIGENTNTHHKLDDYREEDEVQKSDRIEYFTEIEHDGWIEQKRVAILDLRDGIFELRDGDWNLIGEFIDQSSADILTYSEITMDMPVIGEALDALINYLPITESDRSNLSFVQTSERDYQIYLGDELIMKSYINYDVSDANSQGRVHESFYVNFNDADWNQLGSYYGWKDKIGETVIEEVQTTNFRVDIAEENSTDLENKYGPIESEEASEAGIIWDNVDQISIGQHTEIRYAADGSKENVETSSSIEYYLFDQQFNYYEELGRQEQYGARIELFDRNRDLVDVEFDETVEGQETLSWFGAAYTTDVLDFAVKTFEAEITDLTGYLLADLEPVQVDDKTGYLKTSEEKVVATLEARSQLKNGDSEIYWELEVTPLEGSAAGQEFSLEGQQDYNPSLGILFDAKERIHVKFVWPEIRLEELSQEEKDDLIERFEPQGEAANLIDWDNVSQIRVREWRDFEDGALIESEGQVRFIQQDENGQEIWDDDLVVHIHTRGAFEFVSIGGEEGDGVSISLNRDLQDQPLTPLDFGGTQTESIVSNALKAAETNIIQKLGITSIDGLEYLQVGDTGSGWVIDAAGTKIAAFVGSIDDAPDGYGNVSWATDVYDLEGNELFELRGHNEPSEDGGLSADGHYGVYFEYPEMRHNNYEPEEWAKLVAEHAPLKYLAELNVADVGLIRVERRMKLDDDRTSSDDVRTKFYMKDAFGDIIWDSPDSQNIEIYESGGIETYYADEDGDERFLGFALKDGTSLSPVTDPIDGMDWFLTQWIDTMSPEVNSVHSVDISGHKFKATDEGGIVLVDTNADVVVGIATSNQINLDDYWTRGDVKYAWVGIDVQLDTGEQIVVQGNIALDPSGNVLKDTANFMLRPFDKRLSDYDITSEWDAEVSKLLTDYPELTNVLSAQGLEPDWIGRIHSSIDRADWDRGDETFEITEGRERLDIMNGNDWNQPGQIRIEISDVGYEIYIRDESGDNQLVGGEQTAAITDNGPATAAFGANTNQLIENWFDLFEVRIAESFMDYSLPEDGTLSDSMETPLLPDLASLKITDIDVNGQSKTVIIDSEGQAVYIFNDSWVDRDNEYDDGVWWGGQLDHVGSGFSIELNGKAPTDTNNNTGVLLADSGLMRFELFHERVDNFETEGEYAEVFKDFVNRLPDVESSVDPMVHGLVQMKHRVDFETLDSALNKLSDYVQVDFLVYDSVTGDTDWSSSDNVYSRSYEPLLVEYNSNWNVTAIRIDESDYNQPSTFEDTLGAVNSDLGDVANLSESFTAALNGYKFANLGLGVIGVYDPANDGLEAVIFDRGWDNQQSWDIFDISTQEWTGRIRSGERDTGDFEQVWVEADQSDPSLLELAGSIGGIHGLKDEDFPDVAKLMVVEHFVPETGAHYLGFVGYGDNGEYVLDLGVSNDYRSDDLPDPTVPELATGVYSAGYMIAGSDLETLPVPDGIDGAQLMANIEAYMDTRVTEQLVESYDSGAEVVYTPGESLTYSVFNGEESEAMGEADLSDLESMYDIFSEKPDIGVADAGSVEAVMHEMLMSGDTVLNDGDVTLSAKNGLFDVTIKGTTSIDDEAVAAMNDIALIVFNENLDLSLDEYTSTEV